MGRFLSHSKSHVRQPSFEHLQLSSWLHQAAGITADRVPALLKLLEDHWVVTVADLHKTLPALEKHLPAAAYQAIQQGALVFPVATSAHGEDGCETATVTSTMLTGNDDAVTAAAASLDGPYASPVKFSDDGFGYAKRPTCTQLANTMEAARTPSVALAPATTVSPYATRADGLAARRAAFKVAAAAQRRQLRASAGRSALSPDGQLSRVWECGVLSLAVLFNVLVMPLDLAFATPLDGGDSRYDALWFANRAAEIVFCADVAYRVSVAYRERPEEGGRWVFSRRRICTNYLHTWLLVDVVAAAPLELGLWGVRRLQGEEALAHAAAPTYERLLRLLRLLKLLRPGHLYRWIPSTRATEPETSPSHSRRPALHVSLVARGALVAAVALAVLAHWLACAWAFTGMRTAEPLLTAPLPVPAPPPPPVPPPTLLPSPGPPSPSPPLAPGASSVGGLEPTVWSTGCWLAKYQLLALPTPSTRAVLAPHPRVYAAALVAVLAAIGGVDGGAPTPSSWAEHGVASAILIAGGLVRLALLSLGCALLMAAKPLEVAYRRTFAELRALTAERGLSSALTRRLRAFFRHAVHMEAASRSDRVLSRLSPRLRSDAAGAMAPALLRGVHYLSPSATLPLERAFLSEVVLHLAPALHCPREFIPCEHLTIFERGVGAKRGRVLSTGSCIGQDAIVANAALRDTEPAIALGYCQLLTISRGTLLELARPHELASRALRRAAIRLALRHAFIAAAAARVSAQAASSGSPSQYSGLPLQRWFGRVGLPSSSWSCASHACATEGGGSDGGEGDFSDAAAARQLTNGPTIVRHGASSASPADESDPLRAAYAAMESRLQAKLEALAASLLPLAQSSPARGRPGHAPRTAVATRRSRSPGGRGLVGDAQVASALAGAHPSDHLARAWPFSVGAPARRHRSRSVDGDARGGRHSHRCSSHRSSASTYHRHHHHATHHRGASSSRSTAAHGHQFSAELLERIARLEARADAPSGSCTSYGDVPVTTEGAKGAPLQVQPQWPGAAAPQRVASSSYSPPLSAERRHELAVARGQTTDQGVGDDRELAC